VADNCRFSWGEFGCEKPAHDDTEKHSLVPMYFEDDEL
jgi:hypothetical protein